MYFVLWAHLTEIESSIKIETFELTNRSIWADIYVVKFQPVAVQH